MEGILIVNAAKSDLPRIYQLVRNCIDNNYLREQTPGVIRYYYEYHNQAEVLKRLENTFLLRHYDRILAAASIKGAYINMVMVDPELQGQGLGRYLMEALFNEARRKGEDHIKLDAVPGTVGFYRKLGFQGSKEHWMPVRGGERLFYTPMVKKLI